MCPKSLPRERGSQPGHSSNELAAGAVVQVTKVKGPTAPSLAVCAAATLLRVSWPRTTSKQQKSITVPQVSPPLPLPSALIVATAAVSAAARTAAHTSNCRGGFKGGCLKMEGKGRPACQRTNRQHTFFVSKGLSRNKHQTEKWNCLQT